MAFELRSYLLDEKPELFAEINKYDIELDGSETVDEIIDKINGVDLSSEDNKVFDNIVKQRIGRLVLSSYIHI
mgnify:CR=1 FL=1